MDEDEYVTDVELSKRTKIAPSTYKKKRIRGDGPPYIKIGRSVRYGVRTAMAWHAKHERRSTSDRGEAV
jgi:hypothetical protein